MSPRMAPEAALILADALSYPGPDLPARLRAGASRLPAPAAGSLAALADRLAAIGPGAAEELYTATFDLRAKVSPYAGVLLLGPGPRRAALLAFLVEMRAAAGLGAPRELPDHFAEILRTLALGPGAEDASELAALVLVPAARAAAAALPEDNPYRGAFEAIAAFAPGPEIALRQEVGP